MPNIELEPFIRLSPWRKMSISGWRPPYDPQVYGRKEVDMSKALAYIEAESERSGVRITPTDLVIRALALAMKRYHDSNVIVRMHRIFRRSQVNISATVAIPGRKADISCVIIRDADKKDVSQIAAMMRERAANIMRGRDEEFSRIRHSMIHVPFSLYRIVLWTISFLQYTLNLNLGFLGVPRDPFGGAMVTCLGSLGITEAYSPLSPITRVPILLSVGKVEDRPVAVDGQVVVRPVCVLCSTFDHRIMDGYLAGKMAKFIERYMADPEKGEKYARLMQSPDES
ncbi:MAG: 2-oxo acid dehydrogenase subunit E2 [Pirellulales bacterium]|nr:2-oxo acid dehydrogenase subunit E2 [Pirellulales bacterium]